MTRVKISGTLAGIFLLFVFSFMSATAHMLGEDVHTIHITEQGFEPEALMIAVGDTVVFENADTIGRWPASNIHPTHTVYPDTDIRDCGTDKEPSMFDACRELATGEVYVFTFEVAGKWRYHDHVVPEHGGEILVKGETEKVQTQSGLGMFFAWVGEKVTGVFSQIGKLYTRLTTNINDISVVDIHNDDAKLLQVIEVYGPEAVMNRLLEEAGGGSEFDCHQEAHQVGRLSYEAFGAQTFEEGDASCHSGYYHGAMEAFLSEKGTDDLAQNIMELCSVFDTQFGIFECLHGVGHGVMAYEGYDLHASLDACDTLSTQYEARSCYGGVFMENVVAAQGLGAIPGHETSWVSEDDPHMPCNVVGDAFDRRYDCYQMQTSWMLTLNNYDFEKVAGLCLEAPRDMIDVCYKSLGRDAAGYTLRNPEQTIALCAYAPDEEYYQSCITGGVNVVIDFWGPKLKDQADIFCDSVPEDEAKAHCHTVIESRLPELF